MAKKPSKPVDPLNIIGEILGEKARLGQKPSRSGFHCPYIGSECTKRGKKVDGPYPVCSLWRGRKPEKDAHKDLVIVCPKRFYEVDFVQDVIDHCWPGDKPANPRIAPEVTMKGFGNVDFVVADILPDQSVGQFLSVELQAIDITGSVYNFYRSIIEGEAEAKNHSSGFNWDNVYKRYVTQLIRKGFFHHHWKSKIIAVIPDQVFEYIIGRASFMVTDDVKSKDSNIVFATYRMEEVEGGYRPKLFRCVGTQHSALQSAMMYAEAPAKESFAECIQGALSREIDLKSLVNGEKGGMQGSFDL